MGYDEKIFKAKANIKARRLWLVFALLLTAIMVPTQQMALIPKVIISFLLFYAGCLLCVVTYF